MKNLFKNLRSYFNRKKELTKGQEKKAESLIKSYEELINEYRLVQEKKSNLSKKQRAMLQLRIAHLIEKGHIKIIK